MDLSDLNSQPSQISLTLETNAQLIASPITSQTQAVDRDGARWLLRVQYSSLRPDQWRQTAGLIASLRGPTNSVRVPLPQASQPENYDGSTNTTTITSFESSTSITVGLTAYTLVPGDYAEITTPSGTETKIITAVRAVTGGQSLSIEPALRQRTASNASVRLVDCSIKCVLANNRQNRLRFDAPVLGSITLQLVESIDIGQISIVAPIVAGVGTSDDVRVATGDDIQLRIEWISEVRVSGTGTPSVPIAVAWTLRDATYSGATDASATQQYSYAVQASDGGIGMVIGGAIAPNGAIIESPSGLRAINYDLQNVVNSLENVIINAPIVLSASVSPSSGDRVTGQTLRVIVTYSSEVIVTGNPRIGLEIGGNTRYAVANPGTGTVVRFNYVIQSSDADSDGIEILEEIDLNGGAIQTSSPAFATHGYTSGGVASAATSAIYRVSFATAATAEDWGQLRLARSGSAGQSSATHGYNSGGSLSRDINRFQFAASGTASDIGNLTQTRIGMAGQQSATHGFASGGGTPRTSNRIDRFTFSSSSNAIDFANLSAARRGVAGQSSATHGFTSGGRTPVAVATIDSFAFATAGNAADHGDLTVAREQAAGQQSATHGFASGGTTGTSSNRVDRYSFATAANATNHGNLTVARFGPAGQSSATHGFVTGGSTGSNSRLIDRYVFAFAGNASNFSDLAVATRDAAGQQG